MADTVPVRCWRYERLNEEHKVEHIWGNFDNDVDGKKTGHIVMNVKAWLDENPEERKRLGWIKHFYYEARDLQKIIEYNPQTQNLLTSEHVIDEFTIEDEYHVMDKSEEQLLFEDMLSMANGFDTVGGLTFY